MASPCQRRLVVAVLGAFAIASTASGQNFAPLGESESYRKCMRLARSAPTHAEGLLESGILMRLAGDKEGARQDWLELIERHDGTPSAEAAKRNLEKLDLKIR